jgi:DNA-binding XRE family transcriptional regulator
MTLVAFVGFNAYAVNMPVSMKQRPNADKRSIPIDTHKIRRLRESLDLTMEEAAKRAKLADRQTWYQIETGRRSNLTLSVLENVAAALGVKAKDLLK